MSRTATEQQAGYALTLLSEDEEMFRASVREFAEGELRPRVEEMDEKGKLDPALIKQCFDLGLMGIETPEEYGGAGGNFFPPTKRGGEISPAFPSGGAFFCPSKTLLDKTNIL